jgi:hypothetical protein
LAPALLAGAPAVEAAPAAPFTDQNAIGYLGLCNQAGQQISSGNIDTAPFAARVVSSQPALAPYNNGGRVAVLYVFLPIQGLPAGDWSGEQLTASTHYSDPAHPTAVATSRDEPLRTAVSDFPPKWDGFFQLRLFLGTSDEPLYEAHYPALDIQVDGTKWQSFGGGPVDCHSGTAVSAESILLGAQPSAQGSTGSTSGPAQAAASPNTENRPTPTPISTTVPHGAAAALAAGAPDNEKGSLGGGTPRHGSSMAWPLAGSILGVMVVATVVFLVRRRTLGAGPQSVTSVTKKGES